jgi:NTP pyrophosphatase (non-canonical NTP hydrolase)
VRDIQALIGEINDIATAKGWRENDASKDQSGAWFAAYIALVHSEVSDALEAYREGIWSGSKKVNMAKYGGSRSDMVDRPVGVGPELANAIVRILDMADIWCIDIEYELDRVFEYLRQRPYEPCPKLGGTS